MSNIQLIFYVFCQNIYCQFHYTGLLKFYYLFYYNSYLDNMT